MNLSLADPKAKELFEEARKDSLFPQLLLATTFPSQNGKIKEQFCGWARCCGFNLGSQKLYCLPLHSNFHLIEAPQKATLVIGCPEKLLSLHLEGELSILTDSALKAHFWQKLQDIVQRLDLKPDQLLSFDCLKLYSDRFYPGY